MSAEFSSPTCSMSPLHSLTPRAPQYAWYPDTPGAYPASKMSWYYTSGGLYDQVAT